METPLISICIPTYNRAEHLRKTLDSIVSTPEFREGSDVEIVISDNCSPDDTGLVAQKYVSQYPDRIRYSRNETNIVDANFEKVLSLGRGEFLKLHNDTAVLHDASSLGKMIKVVRKAKKERALPFFLNGYCKAKDDIVVDSLDRFIAETRYYCTWIGAFGLWRRDFLAMSDTMRRTYKTKLFQAWVLLDYIAQGNSMLICNEQLFDVATVSKKGGYNIAEIFGHNYNVLLKTHYDQGNLSGKVYRKAKRDMVSFVNGYYFDKGGNYNFDKSGYFKWMLPFYKWNFYFYRKWLRTILKGK